MSDANDHGNVMPPVRVHFPSAFPIETRGMSSEDEPAVIEITKVEYSLEESGDRYDVTFYLSGIKSFSITDDDRECFIRWELFRYGSHEPVTGGYCGTGCIEMGERFIERECTASGIAEGEYTFEILYV